MFISYIEEHQLMQKNALTWIAVMFEFAREKTFSVNGGVVVILVMLAQEGGPGAYFRKRVDGWSRLILLWI